MAKEEGKTVCSRELCRENLAVYSGLKLFWKIFVPLLEVGYNF